MSMLETVKTRRSVRTFDGNLLTQADQEKLAEYVRTIQNPYEIPVEFVFLDAKANGLSSPVLAGDTMYVAAKVGVQAHAEEAFGYSFEKLVLYAWSLGIGTTWIGGTMKRELFEKAASLKDHEIMPCMSPLGYPAKKMSVRELMMRRGVKADERKPASELFFDRAFSAPLEEEDSTVEQALEMVRYAPSAVNRQPWRVLREGKNYHFYLKHDKGYVSKSTGDLQKVDMGIAICHFMSGVEGALSISDPGIPAEAGVEYIASVAV